MILVERSLDGGRYLREICPGLVKYRDESRAAEAKAKAKVLGNPAWRAEAERVKAEAKAANPGFFKRLLG